MMQGIDMNADFARKHAMTSTLDKYVGKLSTAQYAMAETSVLIEQKQEWQQPVPEFVLDLSGASHPIWTPELKITEKHATYSSTHSNILLFGANNLLTEAGAWSCESHAFPAQYINFYNTPAYQNIYKGPKPLASYEPKNGYHIDLRGLAATDICVIDDPVFFATPLEPDNWGRWISTVLPKIYYYQSSYQNRGWKFFCRSEKEWQRRLLGLFGIAGEYLLDHDPGKTYLCKNMETTTYSAADLTPSQDEVGVYANIRERLTYKTVSRHKRIFISRLELSRQAPRYRALQNELELLDALERLGFEAVEPEKLTFAEQVRVLAGAEMVVGLGGSGLYNAAFCTPATRIITIEPSTAFVKGRANFFAALGLRYGVAFGKQDSSDPSPVHKRWTIDVKQAVAAVEKFI